MVNRPPNSSLPTTSAVVKNDTDIPTTPKPTQTSGKDIKQPLLNGNSFKIFHQNIRSLREKTSGIVESFVSEFTARFMFHRASSEGF